MNFKNTFILFFLIGIFSIYPVNADPIITNGGLETGDFTGWTVRVSEGMTISDSLYPDIWGDYSAKMYNGKNEFWQNVNFTGVDEISFDYYYTSTGGVGNMWFKITQINLGNGVYDYTLATQPADTLNTFNYDVSGLNGFYSISFYGFDLWGGRNLYIDNITTDGYIIPPPIEDSFIQFEGTPYKEYDNAIVNFSVEKIMSDYPDKRIYLEIATPKIQDPFFTYAAFELSDYTGYRGLPILGKNPVYDTFHNCSAFIRAYDQDMGDYETLLEIETPVLWDNHTLLNYTGYDYPTNKSYVTGSYIGIDVDIIEYIETDFLYWPDEHFLLHVHAFSNSNQGNREYEYHIDPKYWDAQYYHVHHFSCQPFSSIDSDFNATIESFITVYRNGNTTQLTPTIYTNMYADGYIPEGEEGYEPPDIPEEPEDPDTGENETLPVNPDEPDVPIVTNESINTSWVYYYYEGVNNSFDTLLAPVYNFTGYTLTPIYLLNDSISDYNYIMNESFTETTQKINILSGSFNIIYNSFHPKIIGVVTYYLIWLVLLIILKKR